MATVIQEFKGVPDGEHHVRRFRVGDEVTGDLARVAIAEGWATEHQTRKKPPSNKMDTPDRNKSGPVSRRGRVSRKSSASKSDT